MKIFFGGEEGSYLQKNQERLKSVLWSEVFYRALDIL